MSIKKFMALQDLMITDNSLIPEEQTKSARRVLKPLTNNQAAYIEAINQSIITFCAGVAGTGKTYIAVGKAVDMLLSGTVNRIVLTRPTVECGGEKIGYLPGDMSEKIAPYMRPLLDVLHDFMHPAEVRSYMEADVIEFCPLAYMRGRTFHKTIMILDEAQNANLEQLRMFLTRIGHDSRIIVSGDVTQCDLAFENSKSESYRYVLTKFDTPPYVDGIRTVKLEKKDIVRHSIIQKIVEKIGE